MPNELKGEGKEREGEAAASRNNLRARRQMRIVFALVMAFYPDEPTSHAKGCVIQTYLFPRFIFSH